jgi:hypothetical protein
MLHIHAFNHLGTRLTLSLNRLTHRNTRRTLALSVTGVDAVMRQVLFDEGGEAFKFGNSPAVRLCPSFSASQQSSIFRHADDVVSVHVISLLG